MARVGPLYSTASTRPPKSATVCSYSKTYEQEINFTTKILHFSTNTTNLALKTANQLAKA